MVRRLIPAAEPSVSKVKTWGRIAAPWVGLRVNRMRGNRKRALAMLDKLVGESRCWEVASDRSVEFLEPTAADGEHLAADPLGGGRAEEARGMGDVGRFAKPGDGSVFKHGLLDLRRQHRG